LAITVLAAASAVVLGGTVAGAAVIGGPAAPAAEVLLSRNKPVTASSQGSCCAASNAVDGNAATRWASVKNIDPSWIYVDLGSKVNVSHVRLQWDASCAVAYRVEVSDDHNTWSPIQTVTNGNGGVDDFPGLSASGQFVRVFGTTRCRADASHGYSLQEFDVFGNGDTQPPSVPGQPVVDKLTPTSVDVHWAPSTDNVGVAFYDIIKEGQVCGTVPGTQTNGTCGGLTPDFDYGIYIVARDAAGNASPGSPKTQIHTPKAETVPPSVPTNVHVVPGSLTSTSVTLAWTASTDNSGTIAGYNVYDVRGGGHVQKGGSPNSTPQANIQGLTAGQEYDLVVTAVDPSKNESGDSSPFVPVTPPQGICHDPFCREDPIANDNDVVWGLVTLPDGTLLYNRRDAHEIEALDPATGAKRLVGQIPNSSSTNGEGGVMGLEINPKTFAADHWLYVMHTSPSDNRIVRFQYVNGALGREEILVQGIIRNTFHNGGRLRFSPDGKFLFIAAGDAHSSGNAQNLSNLNGKILRINPDGTIPADNPFHNAIWSYGHRNPQGLAFDSQGNLWEQEFGDNTMDETNVITPGGNYGWPGCEGTFSTGNGKPCGTAGFIKPKHTYPVADGSCSGIAIVRDILYVACERGQSMYRGVISGTNLTSVQRFFVKTFKRLRTVEPTPDGNLWVATSNGGDKDSVPNNSNNTIYKFILGT
jgi:glucose/arabinose dehydrogenase